MKYIFLSTLFFLLSHSLPAQESRPYFQSRKKTPLPVPDSSWTMEITNRSISTLHFKLYCINEQQYKQITKPILKESLLRAQIDTLPVCRAWEHPVLHSDSLHTDTLPMPPLRMGHYLLSISAISRQDTLDEIKNFTVSPAYVFTNSQCRQIINKHSGEISIQNNTTVNPVKPYIRTLLLPSSPVCRPGERILFRSIPYTGNASIGYQKIELPDQSNPETGYFDVSSAYKDPFIIIKHRQSNLILRTSFPQTPQKANPPGIVIFPSQETYSMGDTVELKGRMIYSPDKGIPHIELKGHFQTYLSHTETINQTCLTDSAGYFCFRIPSDSTLWGIYDKDFQESFRCNDIPYTLKTADRDGHTYERSGSVTLREKGCQIFLGSPSIQYVSQPFYPSVRIQNFGGISLQIPVRVRLTRGDAILLDKNFHSPEDFVNHISRQHLPQGIYRLEISTRDKRGHVITNQLSFQRVDPVLKNPLPLDFYYFVPQKTLLAGDSLLLTLGSHTTTPLHLTVNKVFSNSLVKSYPLVLCHEQSHITLPPAPEDRDGYTLQILGFYKNTPLRISEKIQILSPRNPLTVEIIRHKDKIRSGQTYRVKFRVTDSLKQGIPCEVTAMIYNENREKGKVFPHSLSRADKMGLSFYLQDNGPSLLYDNLLFPVYSTIPQYFSGEDPYVQTMTYRQISKNIPTEKEEEKGIYYIMHYIDDVYNGTSFPMKSFSDHTLDTVPKPTAGHFFLPRITTDSKGYGEFEYSLPVTGPEVHLKLIAHTRDMAIGIADAVIRVVQPPSTCRTLDREPLY